MSDRATLWTLAPFDPETRAEVARLMREDPQALHDAFYRDLSFGTGGMRGIMGAGTNRINIYTVRAAAAALARHIQGTSGPVCIGYDTRHHSPLFARETARVLAAAQIPVLLASSPCPTPLVSFACRHFGCAAGVMITASHNPPEYNGFKVYGPDGAQQVTPLKLNPPETPVPVASETSPLIRPFGNEIDQAFLDALRPLRAFPGKQGNLNILYTSLHGTGIRLMPAALSDWKLGTVSLVTAQSIPDGAFPTCTSPNPEEPAALEMGTAQLLREAADLLLATDPDADRIGAVVLHQNQAVRLSGHEIAILLLDHLLSAGRTGTAIKTIVTTELFRKIAEAAGAQCLDVLTGFKYIAELIDRVPFLIGAEESHGYLIGPYVRDKDAIGAGALLAEAVLVARSRGKTVVDRLNELQALHGEHRQALINLHFPDSAEGMAKIARTMEKLRNQPPQAIGGITIESTEDYLPGGVRGLPRSDVLRYRLTDGSNVILRPSGTEPKLKIYIETVGQRGEQRLMALSESIRTVLSAQL